MTGQLERGLASPEAAEAFPGVADVIVHAWQASRLRQKFGTFQTIMACVAVLAKRVIQKKQGLEMREYATVWEL